MEKEEYLNYIESEVNNLLKESTLDNYKNQIFAWRLEADFKRTYKTDYLWNRAIFISSNCALLLVNGGNPKTVMTGLKYTAEIFEYLSELKEVNDIYDKEVTLLLSALCFDLSGYQANGYCIATQIEEFTLVNSTDETILISDNYIINQITNILLKKLPLVETNAQRFESEDEGIILFNIALRKWFDCIFRLDSENEYFKAFETSYKYYLQKKNVFISHLLFLLMARIAVYDNRSIWLQIKNIGNIGDNNIWKKYIKLLAFDYYSSNSIKEIQNRSSIFEFWTSQIRAIEYGLLSKDENFVVQMPTSAGKTFIAELSILKHLTNYPDKKCIYIAPFRALTSEKEIELSMYFSKLGYSVSALSGSYEVDSFQDVIISQTDLLIATPEKIDLLLRVNPDIFNEISLIVVDEGHIIGEISTRATLLEFLIIRLKIKVPDLKTLFISAVMPPENATEYAQWLSGSNDNVLRSLKFSDSTVNDEWEPTRKLIGSFTWEKTNGMIGFKNFEEHEDGFSIGNPFIPNYLKGNDFGHGLPNVGNKPQTTAALAYKLSFEGNTLVFCSQPRFTDTISARLLEIIRNVGDDVPEWFYPDENKESFFYSKIWYGGDYYITEAIKHGIGIHFGDMPEQVRSSVEKDYRNGKLKVLLASNTVGQGLNFPIKNLIFYSLTIGFANKKMINISNRDFWNIVGRAGRAGKETEGKIIFVINSATDLELYKSYTNKANIEEADSLFYKVIKSFHNDRISKNTKDKYIETLSETYLIDLFTEEVIGTDYEEVINKIIDNSLFKVQIEKDNLSLKSLKSSFRKVFKKFEDNLSGEEVAIFKLSGFSYSSNLIIDEFVKNNLEILRALLVTDDYLEFLRVIFDFILSSEIEELNDNKLDSIKLNVEDHFPIMESWVIGTPLDEILSLWKNKQPIANFHLFLSKGLYYLYPWAITSILNILVFRLKIENENIPENIKNLSSYLKYGLNNSTGCLARSLGIKNRDVVNILIPISGHKTGSEFIKWLSNLSFIKVNSLDISDFDKENILSVSRRLTPIRFNKIPEKLTFEIIGTEDSSFSRRGSLRVEVGNYLNYRRRSHTTNNPYTIFVSYKGFPLGRIPAEYSKVLSAEIDINETQFNIIVTDIVEDMGFNRITVELGQIIPL